jgi:perosamine synthetase
MTVELVSQVIEAIRNVAGATCALHEPVFEGHEVQYVSDCIQTGWVSSVGAFVDRFEKDLADFTGSRFAVATVNGTAALHVALLLAGVVPGDEVLIPSLSFVATANAVLNCGGVPHFVDVSESTMGMDPVLLDEYLSDVAETKDGYCWNLQTGRRIAAIVPMHTFGHPCDMTTLCEVASRRGVPIVEDAAESLGSYRDSRHTGTFGLLGIISFNGNKIITTGGGGAILTDDPSLAKRAKHLTTTGKLPHRWLYEHDEHAFNYRMPNINAALGCAQLEQLPGFLERKRRLADAYKVAFRSIPSVTVLEEPSNCRSNYWLNAIRLPGNDIALRDTVLTATNDAGISTRPCWTPLNRLPMFTGSPRSSLSVTDQVFASTINIPSGSGLQKDP